MDGIRHNIIFSVTVHSAMLAAALLIGGSGEIRKAGLMTVLLFDERESADAGEQTPVVLKKTASAGTTVRPAVKSGIALPLVQETAHGQNLSFSSPVRSGPDTVRDAVPKTGEIKAGISSSGLPGSASSAAVSNQATQGGTGGVVAVSTAHGQAENATGSGKSDPSLRSKIRETLQSNLVYPHIARMRRMEGTVLVDFSIDHEGMARHIRIVKGSGYAMLDFAAMETIAKASPFPVADHTIEVPITYRLTRD